MCVYIYSLIFLTIDRPFSDLLPIYSFSLESTMKNVCKPRFSKNLHKLRNNETESSNIKTESTGNKLAKVIGKLTIELMNLHLSNSLKRRKARKIRKAITYIIVNNFVGDIADYNIDKIDFSSLFNKLN